MKLKTVHIREFRSIWDSNPFEVNKITCLVGKNEAGKTAILQALYRLNPIVDDENDFDVTDDYPRSEVEDYQQDIETGKRTPGVVVTATFLLETEELEAIEKEYGKDILNRSEVTVSRGYAKDKDGDSALYVDLPVNEGRVVKNLVHTFTLPSPIREEAETKTTRTELVKYLEAEGKKQDQAATEAKASAKLMEEGSEKAAALENCKTLGESEQAKVLRARLTELQKHKHLGIHIWQTRLHSHFPKFLYFDEYYQMRGHDNVEALKRRKESKTLQSSDHPLLGLIDLARLDMEKLLAADRTQDLKNKLQGASNHLSGKILKYWSQNKHLRMKFDVRQALKNDPEGMQTGTNIWGEVEDTKHLVSTGLATRSKGFVWFFSFLAWYSSVKKEDRSLVLLLDEPGLSLHGKAQEDLLRFFDEEVASNPKHQLLYSTHSPFMVDPKHFDRVRIVQDKSIDADGPLPRAEDGTKVFTDVLEAGPDTLFPLQGALGYEIYQTLFIGPNSLVVEGVSDLLYIQTMSGILQQKKRTGLDSRWTITPVGGADKVPTFVALMRSQKGMKVATLIDFQKSGRQMIENIYKKKILEKTHVLTFADFTGKGESDIEDMFEEEFYLQLVNEEFAGALSKKIEATALKIGPPRIIVRLEDYFTQNPLQQGATFNHYRPARIFAERMSTDTIPDTTLARFEKAFERINALLLV